MKAQEAGPMWMQATRYLVVGGVTFICYFALLGLFFTVLSLPYPAAVAMAYVLAVAVHFIANRSFTFKASGASVAPQLARYAAMVVLNYGLQLAVIFVAYDLAGLHFYLSAFIAILATLVSGFLLMKKWVF